MFLTLYDVQVPESDFIPFQGMGDRVYFGSIASKFGIASYQLAAAQEKFHELYLSLLKNTDITFPGINHVSYSLY